MLRRGWTISFTRRVFQGVASGLAAVMFVVFPHIQNVHVVVVCACTILACNSMALGGFQASYVDIGGNNTGLMFCIGNFLATIGGIVSPLFGSWVVATYGRWELLFYTVAAVQAAGCAAYCRYI